MITRVAWRNLWRRRQRTLFTSLAMGIGVGLAMGMMALQAGIFSEVFDEMVTDSLGHVQLHHPDYPSTRHLHDTLRQSRALIAQSEALTEVRVAATHSNAKAPRCKYPAVSSSKYPFNTRAQYPCMGVSIELVISIVKRAMSLL
mgnify:CR=1 FL=1